ncbi:sensor histidine kinase [Roseospira visakhapatnamensis]|uniref:histidine kinase n=1 Tax=Roseospira visakhapatnamensis TaxID=390880 RepID=A0A7W6REU3_9PROT|nr:ATP-binding protein [Roseospira visakhapatnamensis]MBB4266997.1 PAS domain S-box-containing protein [Roseospira visakhapatnamensis]
MELAVGMAQGGAAFGFGILTLVAVYARTLPAAPPALTSWTLGFLAFSISYVVLIVPVVPPAARLILSDLAQASAGALLVIGTASLRRWRLTRARTAGLWAVAMAWPLVASALASPLGVVPDQPLHGIAGLAFLVTAWGLARARLDGDDGSRWLAAAALAVCGVHQGLVPALHTRPDLIPWSYGTAQVTAIGLALMLALMVVNRQRVEGDAHRTRANRREAQLRDAIEAVSEAFLLCDADDRVVMCNARSRALYAGIADLMVPGTPYETLLRAAVARGVIAEPETANPDDEREAWIQARIARHRDPPPYAVTQRLTGGVVVEIHETRAEEGGRVLIANDITDRVRWEEDLRDSRRRFRDLAEIASDWFWETGPDHRFTFVSNRVERTLGVTPAHFMGRTLIDVSGMETPPRSWRELAGLMDRREQFRDVVVEQTLPKGETRHVRMSGLPIIDMAGTFDGYRGAATDITEQKLTEHILRETRDAAERASRAKAAFLANVSHELRTPLNAIIGFSEIMEAELLGPLENQSYKGYVVDILHSARHLLSVINDILDMSKSEAGRLDLSESEFSLTDLVQDALRMVGPLAGPRGLILASELPLHPPRLFGDERRLRQVMLNLLSNAIKFSDCGSRVAVRAGLNATRDVMVEVSDQGIGMTEAEMREALETFGQVDNRLARRSEGTGLGLPLSRVLMELHGGSLTMTSVKGSGTTVILTMPASRVIADRDTLAGQAPAPDDGTLAGE